MHEIMIMLTLTNANRQYKLAESMRNTIIRTLITNIISLFPARGCSS